MFLPTFFVMSMDFLYAFLTGLTNLIPFMILAESFFFIGINSIGSYWIIRPVKQFLKTQDDFTVFCKRVSRLPYYSAAWIFSIGCLYGLYIFFASIITHKYNFSGYVVTLLGILWGYAFFNSFLLFFIISDYTSKLKKESFLKMGILFSPEKNKISYKLVLGFTILILFPFLLIVSDLVILDTFKTIDPFTRQTIILDVYGSCVGAIICAYYLTRDVSIPLELLLASIEKVRAGNYSHISPVVSNDELGVITAHFNRMVEGLAEKEVIQNVFGKYVTPAVAKEILKHSRELKGENRYITILFTDIQNYTTISESMQPAGIVELLNEYFSSVVNIIQKHNGVVNKFIGDSVMAVFNVPVNDREHSKNAVNAALEIKELCGKRTFHNTKIVTRIGINSGETVVGNIGSEDRLEYTVIGDEVNIAARLEQLNKVYGTLILVGQNTYQDTKDFFAYEKIGDVQLKGKSKSIEVYRIKEEA